MWYILDESNKLLAVNVEDYINWSRLNSTIVKQDKIGEVFVSTVFLGLDHSFNSSIPILWETLVFGIENDMYQNRYASYEDALIGHQKTLDKINNLISTEDSGIF